MNGRALATQLNKPFAAGFWRILQRSDRGIEQIAQDAGISVSQLYAYCENATIMPAFRMGGVIAASGSVRVELAEYVTKARLARLVVLDEDGEASTAEAGLQGRGLELTVDVGEVVSAILQASHPDSDGGTNITVAELDAILVRTRRLAHHTHELERAAAKTEVL